MAMGRLRRTGVCGAPAAWIETLDRLRDRLRMTRPVTLLESCFAEVPMVIGHLRPVILMPVGLLAGLPTRQVEAILLHELAHIRRADYLVNLMQTLAEGLLFYHPAVWWISSVIREERENCCHDLVVSTNHDAHEYATALAALAENRWAREVALAATGGDLVARIRRLLAQPEGPRMTIAPLLSVVVLLATGGVALTAWQTPAPQPVQSQTSTYDKWLKEEVVYIITDQERADFKKLGTDAERERFVATFWTRRDPTPGTPRNEYREEHYRRIAYANDRFAAAGLPGWKTDRGRIYIQHGPPDEIDAHPSGGAYKSERGAQTVTFPFEQWRYRLIEGIGNNVILEFVDKAKTGEYRLTRDPSEKEITPAKPAEINYRDLEAVVGGPRRNFLPMKVQVDYDRIAPSYVLTRITIQLDPRDLHFHDRDNISTATVNIYGRVSTLARRPLSPFEDVVKVMQSTATLQGLIEENAPQVYQKTLPLEPGRYRLNITAKDIVSGNLGTYDVVLDVPQAGAR
jgi:GWxTD domain-containing protein